MSGPHVEQTLQEGFSLQKQRLIELLLLQIVIVMHGMH